MENEELVSLIQQGTDVSENLGVLYQQNEGMLKKIVLPLSEYAETDDLMQEAFLGLWDAVNNFDPSLNVKFMTYAPYRIRMHCIRYIENNRLKRIPVHMVELINKYKKLCENADVDEQTARKELKLSKKQYDFMIQTMQNDDCISLDSMVKTKDENLTVADTIADDTDIEQEVLEGILTDDLWKALDVLDEKKKEILLKRYKEGQEQKQIADDLGLSRQRIFQLEREALDQLKQLQKVQELAEAFDYNCSLAYRSGLQRVKDGKGSNVELLAIKHLELEEQVKRKQKNLRRTMNLLEGCSQNPLLYRISQLCKEKGISRRTMEADAGLGVGASSKWNRYQPRQNTLQKVADFFGVSIEYLKGETERRS